MVLPSDIAEPCGEGHASTVIGDGPLTAARNSTAPVEKISCGAQLIPLRPRDEMQPIRHTQRYVGSESSFRAHAGARDGIAQRCVTRVASCSF